MHVLTFGHADGCDYTDFVIRYAKIGSVSCAGREETEDSLTQVKA
jgi:hypothetical protein